MTTADEQLATASTPPTPAPTPPSPTASKPTETCNHYRTISGGLDSRSSECGHEYGRSSARVLQEWPRLRTGQGDQLRIAVVLGTRPEIVKLAPLIRELGPIAYIVYTGQHYDEDLAGSFFDSFRIPRPASVVSVGNMRRGEQIGVTTAGLTRLFVERPPNAVVVQGDTNSVLGGALAANSVDIPLVHLEAGLRSHDRAMPEEHNRVLTDHIADLLLAPTSINEHNLERENVAGEIVVTGNTVVEAVQELLPDAEMRTVLRARYGLPHNGYIVTTIHRPENTDSARRLREILFHLAQAPLPVIFPAHPRTMSRIRQFGLTASLGHLKVVPPMNYETFLALCADAALLVSDSGGVQEEVTVYKRPLVVVRNSTERPEVLESFAVRVTPESLTAAIRERLQWAAENPGVLHRTPSPYGTGDASRLSAKAILELVS